MTIQMSTALRNARLQAITDILGPGWKLKIRTGAQPANVAAGSTGTVLVVYTPTADAPANGAINMVDDATLPLAGTGVGAGNAGHYELTTSTDVVHERGSVTATGGGGDLTIDNVVIAIGQAVNVTGFVKTEPGA